MKKASIAVIPPSMSQWWALAWRFFAWNHPTRNRPVKRVAINWLKSAPIVACVPKNPASPNHSIVTTLLVLISGAASHNVVRAF